MTNREASKEIALITHEFAPDVGGVASVVKTIVGEIERRGQAPLVVTRRLKLDSSDAKGRQVSESSSVLRVLPQSWRRPQALGHIARSLAWIRRLEKRNSDIVFCDAGALLVALFFLVVFRRAPRGHVILHGTEVLRFASGRFRTVRRLFHRLLLDRHLDVIAISQSVATEIDKHFPGAQPRVVYNGFDFEKNTAPSRPQATSHDGLAPLQVLVVGRLDYRKRIDLLLKAGPLIASRRVCLHIVGDGVTRASLKAMVERYSSDTLEVVFHGRVSDAALAERYQSADLVFVPAGRRNLSMEGFGLTVLEALNRGVIPIALDLDGPGEIARLIGCPTVSAEVKEIATFLNSVDLDKLYASFPAFAKNLEKFSVRGQVDALFGASG